MTDGVGDPVVADLYCELQPQLVRILASNLPVSDWVIDDACQTAWSAWLERRDAVMPGSELGWLSTTATREALRLLRCQRGAEPYERLPAPTVLADSRPSEPAPEQRLELQERLAEVRQLPAREQRVLMLHGYGYEYGEIAAVTGESRRTVARQLMRARQRLLRLAGES
jgi:RNA polymerase sigma factor (sigma-70 family)